MSDWAGTGTAVSGVGAPGASIWTPDSLCEQLMGEVNQDLNAAGGDVPPRMRKLVVCAYRDLWNLQPWRFRRRRVTLTIAAAASTAACPADFEKLDQKWLEENADEGTLHFTTVLQVFEARKHRNGTTPGTPELVFIEPAEDLSSGYSEIFRCTPTASKEFTYPYVYLCYAPDVANDASPLWPQPFFTGWEWGARARAYYDFRRDTDAWKGPNNRFKGWLEGAVQENNEGLTSDTPAARDDHGDVEALASSHWLRGWG